MEVVTVAERPELTEPAWERTSDVLPEYNSHGEVLNRYWGRLTEERAEFQFHLVGDRDEILARARSIPVRWNGSLEDLPAGIDGAIARGFEEGAANVLCALVIMVPRDLQGRRLSAIAVQGMLELARRHRLAELIAPVRPTWKERYPLVPIDRYAAWRREDGLLFDPWMRVHERLGATILKPEPQSLRITGTVAEWEEWTSMTFPESGDYWFPLGLATLAIDCDADRGRYWEPNVWMRHSARTGPWHEKRRFFAGPFPNLGQTSLRHLAAGEARPHPYRVRLTPWPATDYDVDAGTGFHPNPSARALRHDPAALTSARERVTDSAEAALGGAERTPRPRERFPE